MSQEEALLSYARAQRRAKEKRAPDIGDTVHFWDGDACRAAIVGAIDAPLGETPGVDLMVLQPVARHHVTEEGLAWRGQLSIAHDESKDVDTWHWPCGGQ